MQELKSSPYRRMREVTYEDYKAFVESNRELVFSDRIGKRKVIVEIGKTWKVSERNLQPKNFQMESTTIWSFPHRGDWATHKGNYRGNWPPQMARNIVLRYSKPGETVLDQMCGSGTTLVECKLLGRNAIGVDISEAAAMLTLDRLNFQYPTIDAQIAGTTQRVFLGDARNLNLVESHTIDLIATHPPYANIIPYSREKELENLSTAHSIDEYVEEMRKVAREIFRVLKPGRFMAILVGDTRRHKHYVPIAFRTMEAFLQEGFTLREDIIKHQWRCKSTPFWLKKSLEANFHLIIHEHLFVFRKPVQEERLDKLRDSMAWH